MWQALILGRQVIVVLLISQPLCLGQEKQASKMGSFLGVETENSQNSNLEPVVQAQIQNL